MIAYFWIVSGFSAPCVLQTTEMKMEMEMIIESMIGAGILISTAMVVSFVLALNYYAKKMVNSWLDKLGIGGFMVCVVIILILNYFGAMAYTPAGMKLMEFLGSSPPYSTYAFVIMVCWVVGTLCLAAIWEIFLRAMGKFTSWWHFTFQDK